MHLRQLPKENAAVDNPFSDFMSAPWITRRLDHLAFCADAAPAGVIAEFGVWQGESLRVLVDHANGRPVYGFDSFTGLPEPWDIGGGRVYEAGHFALDGIPAIEGATLIKGWFGDTVSLWAESLSLPISLAHIDGDLKSSALTVLEAVAGRLADWAIIVFDELAEWPDGDLIGLYPNWQSGEWAALIEWAKAHKEFSITPFRRTRGQAGSIMVQRM